jgi:predicted nucleic acid-binding protein
MARSRMTQASRSDACDCLIAAIAIENGVPVWH